jgi:hypothetical protein
MIGLVGGLIAFFNCYDLITITKCHKQEYTWILYSCSGASAGGLVIVEMQLQIVTDTA